MADKITKEQRSKNMKAIQSQSKLENTFSKMLWRNGYRYRKNDKTLFGKPDISIKKYKIVIFIDSCFWHGCEIHGNIPKSNREYWIPKLERNKKRDLEVNQYYDKKNWFVKRIWEHELKENSEKILGELCLLIDQIKARKT